MQTAFRIGCVLCCFLMPACALTRSATAPHDEAERCQRSVSVTSPLLVQPSKANDPAQDLPGYSDKQVKIASALGLLPELRRLEELEQQAIRERSDLRFQKLELHHQLLSHVVLIMLEVNSAKAEAQCEEARVNEIGERLRQTQEDRTKMLTLSSIIVSGVASLVSGVFILTGSTVPDAAAAITGGVVGSTLGATALAELTDYDLKHQRNILREVWEGPDTSNIFPPSVWHFLNSPRRDDRTPREHLVSRWEGKFGISRSDQEKDGERAKLLFGPEGTYTLDDLRARATMLSMLASTIDLIQQDIEELLRHILLKSPRPHSH